MTSLSMRDAAREHFDRIDALKPGSGSLEALLFGRGTAAGGGVGAGLYYDHRLSTSWGAFAEAEIGYHWGDRTGLGWQALAGVRGRW